MKRNKKKLSVNQLNHSKQTQRTLVKPIGDAELSRIRGIANLNNKSRASSFVISEREKTKTLRAAKKTSTNIIKGYKKDLNKYKQQFESDLKEIDDLNKNINNVIKSDKKYEYKVVKHRGSSETSLVIFVDNEKEIKQKGNFQVIKNLKDVNISDKPSVIFLVKDNNPLYDAQRNLLKNKEDIFDSNIPVGILNEYETEYKKSSIKKDKIKGVEAKIDNAKDNKKTIENVILSVDNINKQITELNQKLKDVPYNPYIKDVKQEKRQLKKQIKDLKNRRQDLLNIRNNRDLQDAITINAYQIDQQMSPDSTTKYLTDSTQRAINNLIKALSTNSRLQEYLHILNFISDQDYLDILRELNVKEYYEQLDDISIRVLEIIKESPTLKAMLGEKDEKIN